MASGNSGSSSPGGPTRESRAIDSALASGQLFQTPTMRMARGISDGVISRFAPEEGAVEGSRALHALAFADRIITPYVGQAESSASAALGQQERGTAIRPLRVAPISSWLFPVPWYQDELDWLAAARTTAPVRGVGASTHPAVSAARPSSPVSFSVALEYVAPSMSRPVRVEPLRSAPTVAVLHQHIAKATPSPRQPSAQAVARMAMPLRAWSPLVSFPAAQAAEVMAGVLSATHDFDDESARVAAPMMEYVAPRQMARSAAEPVSPVGSDAARIAPTPSPSRAQPLGAAIRARLTEALRRPALEERPLMVPTSTPVLVEPEASATSAPAEVVAPREVEAQAPAPTPVAPTPVVPAARVMRDATVATASSTPPAPTAPPTTPTVGARVAPTPVTSTGAAELLARSALSDGSQMAAASGPRVALPVGLGGLVTALRAAQVVSRPLLAPTLRPLVSVAPTPVSAPVARGAGRTPAAPSLDLVMPAPEVSYTESSLAAMERNRPAALGHVAWADRWLARFAGASAETLVGLDEVATPNALRQHPHLLGAAAPSSVYLTSPLQRRMAEPGLPALAAPAASSRPASAEKPVAAAPTTSAVPPAMIAADDDVVSDEVFARISAAAVSERSVARKPAPSAAAVAAAAERMAAPIARRPVADRFPRALPALADRLLRVPPTLPGAGMKPGLAASPLAPALANVVPLPASSSFDVRSVTSSVVAGAYLAGSIEPITVGFGTGATRPSLVLGSHRAMATMPGMAPADPRFLELAVRAPTPEFFAAIARGEVEPGVARAGAAPTSSPASVPSVPAPTATVAIPTATAAPSEALLEPAAPVAGTTPAAALEVIDEAGAPGFAATPSAADAGLPDQVASPSEPLFTTIAAPFLPAGIELAPPTRHEPVARWSPRPGSTAQMAHDWSVDQHRSSADLSFDFVPPELIIAARTYGFGPIEAARAARLAVAGEGGLMAMASAVDMTFIEALSAQSHETTTAGYAAAALGAAAQAQAAQAQAAQAQATGTTAAAAATAPRALAATLSAPAYEPIQPPLMHRAEQQRAGRIPRGAFLWPRAAANALELRVADADATYPYSLAALDLIAAHVVAEAGSYPIQFEEVMLSPSSAGAPGPVASAAGAESTLAATAPVVSPLDTAIDEPVRATGRPVSAAEEPPTVISDLDEEPAILPPRLLSSAGGHPPTMVREQFHAIYLALSQSPTGRSMSPTVRAARALALAQQASHGTGASARTRAAAAWAVMPMVMTTADTSLDPVYLSGGEPATVVDSAAAQAPADTSRRVHLELVAARAGRSLQSLVAPSEQAGSQTAAASYQPSSPATPMVETGTSEAVLQRALLAARHDATVELPSWFEAAARKVFSEGSSEGEGMSLAEMTLVQTTPVRQLAARPAGASTPAAASAPATGGGDGSQPTPDVEKLAREIYAEICMMIDIARERSGDPWQS